MNTVEFLTEAKALIERGWCQGEYARDSSGNDVVPRDDSACQWCSFGAMVRVNDIHWRKADFGMAVYCLQLAVKGMSAIDIIEWNDDKARTKDEVVNAFERAIVLAPKTEI